ncbi:hypothetical protein BELL_0294g00030 [Botrytis elliptica]|uniref:Uncharacterized protein n=1 Tax=Botrytis elliptica TaxID=278938 RepID=A0A4Z1JRR6_9HELO|nr:hypothetical protein BELL_0294g00030 [Botrytis elliptica]
MDEYLGFAANQVVEFATPPRFLGQGRLIVKRLGFDEGHQVFLSKTQSFVVAWPMVSFML